MANYNPPNEDLPIYNPTEFSKLTQEISSGDSVSSTYLKANFLQFPVAQGTEQFSNIVVNGSLTLNNNTVVSGDITADTINYTTLNPAVVGANEDGNNVFTAQNTFTNSPTITATMPDYNDNSTKIPTTLWFNNEYIERQINYYNADVISKVNNGGSQQPFPINTIGYEMMDIVILGGAGNSGVNTTPSGDIWKLGGSGGGGACVAITSIDCRTWDEITLNPWRFIPAEWGTYVLRVVVDTINGVAPVGYYRWWAEYGELGGTSAVFGNAAGGVGGRGLCDFPKVSEPGFQEFGVDATPYPLTASNYPPATPVGIKTGTDGEDGIFFGDPATTGNSPPSQQAGGIGIVPTQYHNIDATYPDKYYQDPTGNAYWKFLSQGRAFNIPSGTTASGYYNGGSTSIGQEGVFVFLYKKYLP